MTNCSASRRTLNCRIKALQLLFAAVASTLLLSACYTQRGYVGKHAENPARVAGYGVFLKEANGVPISDFAGKVELHPGENTIRFTIDPTNFNSRGPDEQVYQITFNAAPNEDYAITGRRGDGRLCAWRVIPETGQPDFSRPLGCHAAAK